MLEKFLQMDPIGAALVMAAVVCYILGVQYGGVEYPWNSSKVIGLLVGAGLITIAWVVLEYFQGERSMIPRRLFRRRTVWVMCLYAFIFAGGYFAVVYYLPIYFQSVDGTSPIISGVRNLPMILAVTFGTIASGIIITVTGRYQPLLIGGSVVGTIGAGLLYTLDTHTSTGKWIGYEIVAGVGWGVAFQVPIIAIQGTTEASDLSSVTAILLCKCWNPFHPRYPLAVG